LGVDFGGLAFRLGKWAFAASADLSENYGRPLLEYRAEERGIQVYSIRAEQAGWLRSFNLTAARTISRRLSAGLGFRILKGELERTTAETFAADGVLIDDERRQTLSGTSWSAGLTYAFSGRVSGGLVFQAPFVLRASSRSLLEYRAPEFGTDIAIAADERDRYERPWAAGAGVSWRPAERLRVVSDVRFVKWSSYKASYFGEPRLAVLNVWTPAWGIEIQASIACSAIMSSHSDRIASITAYEGPGSTYTYLTFGSGLAMGASVSISRPWAENAARGWADWPAGP
jgi:opacity protein-like surface antigen